MLHVCVSLVIEQKRWNSFNPESFSFFWLIIISSAYKHPSQQYSLCLSVPGRHHIWLVNPCILSATSSLIGYFTSVSGGEMPLCSGSCCQLGGPAGFCVFQRTFWALSSFVWLSSESLGKSSDRIRHGSEFRKNPLFLPNSKMIENKFEWSKWLLQLVLLEKEEIKQGRKD